MSSTSKLSTSTLSLRFMQRATKETVLPQQAKLLDDSEWQVSQEVLDTWERQKLYKTTAEDAVHESSYLPFMFEKDLGSAEGKEIGPSSGLTCLTTKRVFGRVQPNTVESEKQKKDDDEEGDDLEERDKEGDGDEDEDTEQSNRRAAPSSSKPHSAARSNVQSSSSNLPNRRPGPLLSKGARLVQMARDSQAKAKTQPKSESSSNFSTVSDRLTTLPKPAASLRQNPQLDPAVVSFHHRDVTRKLMKPGVHMPIKGKEKESQDDGGGDGDGDGMGRDEVKNEESEERSVNGKKKKRKRQDKRVDVLKESPHKKKLKEIQ